MVLTSALGFTLPFGRPLIAAVGAAALFMLVLTFSSSGRTGLTPMKITLCGVAMSAFASSITATVLILDEQTLLAMRTGWREILPGLTRRSFAAHPGCRCGVRSGALAVAIAQYAGPGDRMAQGLGVSLLKTRLLALLAIALLCGAAVSIAGPIGFIGGRATADPPSGVGGLTRDGAVFSCAGHWCYCWRISRPVRCLRRMSWPPGS